MVLLHIVAYTVCLWVAVGDAMEVDAMEVGAWWAKQTKGVINTKSVW